MSPEFYTKEVIKSSMDNTAGTLLDEIAITNVVKSLLKSNDLSKENIDNLIASFDVGTGYLVRYIDFSYVLKKFRVELGFYKHSTLGFIVRIDSFGFLSFGDDWIMNMDEPIPIGKGVVVYDPIGTWGEGKESENWAIKEHFEKCSRYIIDIDKEKEMWDVTDLSNGNNYYGGYYETGSEKNYQCNIEWDSDCPVDEWEEIEELIKNNV